MQPHQTDLDTDRQPPLSIPFAHFVSGGVLLIVGGGVAGLGPLLLPIRASSAGTIHLLLAGWIGLTIMGAMTQFVPVWSGTALHSRRLSIASLWLVLGGVGGLVTVFYTASYGLAFVPATVLLAGFWTFAYNIVRSLPPVSTLDITEGHFLFSLSSLVLGTGLGWVLVTDLGYHYLPTTGPISIHGLLMAHLTLTIFGFVTATIVGALVQLAPMFTQSESTRLDSHLLHVEMVSLPTGVWVLALGRLLGNGTLGRLGSVLVLSGIAFAAIFLLRGLHGARVELDPLLRRYWIVGVSMLAWAALTAPVWFADPLGHFARFGSARATHLLFVGVFVFTIVGTFYHVVPFIIWYHSYSDRLGYERVPMMDDLYWDRLARIEFVAMVAGLVILVLGELLGLPTWTQFLGGNLLGAGVLVFAANMALVVKRHRPETIREVGSIMVGHGVADTS
ncbi:MAG: hypothetical protein ABEJ58_08825 [Halodesulfurarchaeum sp.]